MFPCLDTFSSWVPAFFRDDLDGCAGAAHDPDGVNSRWAQGGLAASWTRLARLHRQNLQDSICGPIVAWLDARWCARPIVRLRWPAVVRHVAYDGAVGRLDGGLRDEACGDVLAVEVLVHEPGQEGGEVGEGEVVGDGGGVADVGRG